MSERIRYHLDENVNLAIARLKKSVKYYQSASSG